jgi:hypothetical protein
MEDDITQGISTTYTTNFNDDLALDKVMLPIEFRKASDDGVIRIQ